MRIKIFKNIILFLMLAIASSVSAQQGAILKPMEIDSANLELYRRNEYRQFISGDFLNESENQKINFPGFKQDFSYRQGYNLNLDFINLNSLPLMSFSTESINSFNSPFFHNGVILSEGAYSLGKKFIFGGFSYGANSIFSAPLPGQQLNNLDRYGSTMFMQYKVSKKFKIQTRINVSKSPLPDF